MKKLNVGIASAIFLMSVFLVDVVSVPVNSTVRNQSLRRFRTAVGTWQEALFPSCRAVVLRCIR